MLPQAEDSDDIAVEKVAKRIISESKELKTNGQWYNTRIDLDDALCDCSSTLLCLLFSITSKLHSTMPAALIGNNVTRMVTNMPTTIQIALGVTVQEKMLFGVILGGNSKGKLDQQSFALLKVNNHHQDLIHVMHIGQHFEP